MLAIDDRRALSQARRLGRSLRLLTTQDLMVWMLRERLLDVSQADAIKDAWANHHSFCLSIQSFADLLG